MWIVVSNVLYEITSTAPWLLLVGALIVGSVFGSFLNVVVFRLPRGQSIVHPRSRCPACGHTIRSIDNIPVVSWWRLRGRCRDCGAAISPRYPLVEALTAGTFCLLITVDVLLPATSAQQAEIGTLWGRYLFHLALVSTLICVALIDYDQLPVPRQLILLPAVSGLVLTIIWPWLRQNGALLATGSTRWNYLVDGLLAVLLGGATAAVCFKRVAAGRVSPHVGASVLLGAFVGLLPWMTIVAIACWMWLIVRAVGRASIARMPIPWSAWVVVATIAYLVMLRRLPWLGYRVDAVALAAAAGLAGAYFQRADHGSHEVTQGKQR